MNTPTPVLGVPFERTRELVTNVAAQQDNIRDGETTLKLLLAQTTDPNEVAAAAYLMGACAMKSNFTRLV
jgi:hypothetical protein